MRRIIPIAMLLVLVATLAWPQSGYRPGYWIRGKAIPTVPSTDQDGQVLKYYETGDTMGWADDEGGAGAGAAEISDTLWAHLDDSTAVLWTAITDTAWMALGAIGDTLWAHLDDSTGILWAALTDTTWTALGAIGDSLWTHLDDSTAILWTALTDTTWMALSAIGDTLWTHLDDSTAVLWTALTDTTYMALGAIGDSLWAHLDDSLLALYGAIGDTIAAHWEAFTAAGSGDDAQYDDGDTQGDLSSPFVLQEGSNITFTYNAAGGDADTLTIAAGAGSGDNAYADLDSAVGSDEVDLGSPFVIQEGYGIILAVDNDTLKITAIISPANVSDTLWAHLDDTIVVVRTALTDTVYMALGAIGDTVWAHLDDSTAVLWTALTDTTWAALGAIGDTLWAHLDDSTGVLWTALTDTTWATLGAISDTLWTHLGDSTAILWTALTDTSWMCLGAIGDTLWAHLDDSTAILWTALTDTSWMALGAIGDTLWAHLDDSLLLRGLVAGQTWTGTHDFGGTVLEVPNGNDPTTGGAGRLAYDLDDKAIEVYGTEGRLIPTTRMTQLTIYDPDGIQSTAAEIPIMAVDSTAFPDGIVITGWGVSFNAAPTNLDAVLHLYEAPATYTSDIDSIRTSSIEARNVSISAGTVGADNYVFLKLSDVDVDWMHVWFTYYIKEDN